MMQWSSTVNASNCLVFISLMSAEMKCMLIQNNVKVKFIIRFFLHGDIKIDSLKYDSHTPDKWIFGFCLLQYDFTLYQDSKTLIDNIFVTINQKKLYVKI